MDEAEVDTFAHDLTRPLGGTTACFICGKSVHPALAFTVSHPHGIALHAHGDCLNGRSAYIVSRRYYLAVDRVVREASG